MEKLFGRGLCFHLNLWHALMFTLLSFFFFSLACAHTHTHTDICGKRISDYVAVFLAFNTSCSLPRSHDRTSNQNHNTFPSLYYHLVHRLHACCLPVTVKHMLHCFTLLCGFTWLHFFMISSSSGFLTTKRLSSLQPSTSPLQPTLFLCVSAGCCDLANLVIQSREFSGGLQHSQTITFNLIYHICLNTSTN